MYLYLSQIPYTGIELGPLGTFLYWLALVLWSVAVAYLALFRAIPYLNKEARAFGQRVQNMINTQPVITRTSAPEMPKPAPRVAETSPDLEVPRYLPHEGFKSFAREGALSIEDIVKGLSRVAPPAPAATPEPQQPLHEEAPAPAMMEAMPSRRANVEPIYENVEPVTPPARPAQSTGVAPHIRGFIAALFERDREAVFASLRNQVRGGGSAEALITEVTLILDDVYRARIDGTEADADVSRLIARYDTPTLEKLIGALATSIDSSYSTGVTGAKLALTRALSVLGA